MRQIAVAACLAILSAGCGAEDRKKSGAPAPRDEPRVVETTPTEPKRPGKDARSATSSVLMGAGDGHERFDEDLYGVFSRPATNRDRAFTEEITNFTEGCGEPLADKTRVLLDDVGDEGSDLVAVPTSEGLVAFAVLPMGSGACGRPLQGGLMVAGSFRSEGAVNYGLVPDDVESVEVVVNGVAHKARIGENGFAVELTGVPEHTAPPPFGRVVVHRRDGTTQEF